MATRPKVTSSLVSSGGGLASGVDALAVFFCSTSGPYTARLVRKYSDVVSTYDRGIAASFASLWFAQVPKPLLMLRMPTVTAGSIGPVNNESVTGTSVITWTGTPIDRESIKLVVVAGGTIGAAGITIKVSRDGGRTYGPVVRLGTATTYVVPLTGVTANFAAGTLVAGDWATAECYPPISDNAGLTAARVALAAQSVVRPRAGIMLSEITSQDLLQDVIDEANAYETANSRHIRIFTHFREISPIAYMQGNPTDVDFAADDTITRNTGSWVTDGFRVGQDVTISGSASNNGSKGTVTNVTATVLTLSASPGLALEANVLGSALTIIGTESDATWQASLGAIAGDSEATMKIADRVLYRAATGRIKSPADGTRKQRPVAWFSAIRTMQHERHVSEAQVDLGGLAGVTITDTDGVIERGSYDERVSETLLAYRIASTTTHDGFGGIYMTLPLTGAEDNGQLSRAPVGFVGDLLCQLAQTEATKKLGKGYPLQADGTFTPASLSRINREVTARLRAAVLSPGPEGPMASDVSFEMSGDVDMRETAAVVPCEVSFLPLGYLEQITIRVLVSRAGTTEEA